MKVKTTFIHGKLIKEIAANATGPFKIRMGPGVWVSQKAGEWEGKMVGAFPGKMRSESN